MSQSWGKPRLHFETCSKKSEKKESREGEKGKGEMGVCGQAQFGKSKWIVPALASGAKEEGTDRAGDVIDSREDTAETPKIWAFIPSEGHIPPLIL